MSFVGKSCFESLLFSRSESTPSKYNRTDCAWNSRSCCVSCYHCILSHQETLPVGVHKIAQGYGIWYEMHNLPNCYFAPVLCIIIWDLIFEVVTKQ